MRYRRGTSRFQQSFLSIDDSVSGRNVVRVFDEICEDFCSNLIEGPDFEKGQKETGRKAYHPADLLKILVYGYFNGVSSSRKLERECGRNIELQWLTSGLLPDHKTISDFRKDNGELVKGLFVYLIRCFKEKGLLQGKSVSVDGTKIKAYARQEINLKTIKEKLEGIEKQTIKYLKDLDAIDQAEDGLEVLEVRKAEMERELEKLAGKKKFYESQQEQLVAAGEERISTTDRQAKMMKGRYGHYWGYNAQASVDNEAHMITSIEVTNEQNDKGQLTPTVQASEQTTEQKVEEVNADGGYYKINELEALEENGTACYVAINKTPSQKKDQEHGLSFTYRQQEDCYYCVEGKKLLYKRKKTVDDRPMRVYQGVACSGCLKKEVCTTSEARSVHRNENQDWIDDFHTKMKSPEGKEHLKTRRSAAEHPFGTMKYYMGQIPLLLRGKKKVQTEMHLYAIGYNLKRYFTLQLESKLQQTDKMRRAA